MEYDNSEHTEKSISKLDLVKETIQKNFPDDPEVLEGTLAAMSVIACLLLSDLPHCIGLNFSGPPSSHKTTVLDFFEGLDFVYRSDRFTPKAFVSHYAGVSKKALEQVDLLPKIRHKCILVSELAPIFNARREELVDNIGILTRVFDGRGYLPDSGVHGQRGYTGDYRFVWLGATTPLPYSAWQIMGKLGSRWVFFDMTGKTKTESQLTDMLTGKAYLQKIKECRSSVKEYMNSLWQRNGGFGGVIWDMEADSKDLVAQIARMASSIAKWRGILQPNDESGYNPPQIEQPERLGAILYCIARGRALVFGRRNLEHEDVKALESIAYSSMPEDRRRICQALKKHSRLDASQIMNIVRCAKPTAISIMKQLNILGVVSFSEVDRKCWIEMTEVEPELAEIKDPGEVVEIWQQR